MTPNLDVLIPLPEGLDDSILNDILSYGSVTIQLPKAVMRKGQCFHIGRNRYVRCTGCHPVYSDSLLFIHELVLIPGVESDALFSGKDPETVMKAHRDARKVRLIAKDIGRFEDLRHLVPELNAFADSLDGGTK